MIKLLKYIKKQYLIILIAIVLIFIQVMTNLNLPRMMSRIINEGVLQNDVDKIWSIGLDMIIITIISSLAIILASYLLAKIAALFGENVRKALFTKVTYASKEQLSQFGVASLVTRSTNDITQLQQFIVMWRPLIMAPLMGVGGIIMAISEAPSMSYIIFVVILLLMITLASALFFALPLFKSLQVKLDKLNRVLREFLTGLRVIKAFNKSEAEKQRFKEANQDLTDTTRKVTRIMVFIIPVMMLIMNASTILIIWVGGHQIISNGVEIGSIMAFMQYVMQVLFSFLMLAMIFVFIPRAQVSAGRINEVLDSPDQLQDIGQKAKPAEVQNVSLEFRNVTFKYQHAERAVLKNISFKGTGGEFIAIIGGTGSGKTTLIDLLPRFYDVSEGEILINGINIKEYSLKNLRDYISLVPQKAVIFNGTIKDNITLGSKEGSDAEVEKAAAIAQASEFIETLDQGYETPVAQDGSNLSGGQKQRLSIARAIFKNPDIYIFDDSFSALDFKTDSLLRKALRENIKSKLILTIAQRVNTILDADKIIVLDKGEIVGIGTHKELYQSNEVYKEIVLSQMEEGEVA
ncbi:MAG: ABC transporter ATP-binding protein/permease [Fusobacteria bacterium]|nr:ABC transporter ATP-binding protein/permease [Fusobacteriota bacterium]